MGFAVLAFAIRGILSYAVAFLTGNELSLYSENIYQIMPEPGAI